MTVLKTALQNTNNTYTSPFGDKQIVTKDKTTTVTASTYTVKDTDTVLFIDSTLTTACTITIPSILIAKSGWGIDVVDSGRLAGTNYITIQTEGSELIGGNESRVIRINGGTENLISNGTNVYLRTLYTPRSSVFASLNVPQDITITTADTLYPVVGTYSNDPMVGFSLNARPSIQYEANRSGWMKILITSSLSCTAASSTASIGASIYNSEGTLVKSDVVPFFLKTATEPVPCTFQDVVWLENGYEVQLVATSDGDGDVLTFKSYSASIQNFI